MRRRAPRRGACSAVDQDQSSGPIAEVHLTTALGDPSLPARDIPSSQDWWETASSPRLREEGDYGYFDTLDVHARLDIRYK